MTKYFTGEDIAVRPVAKRTGGTRYGLYRPLDMHMSIIEEFSTLEFANLVAKYVEDHGGGYSLEERTAAVVFAHKELG